MRRVAWLALFMAFAIGCGKEGPPLPPLVRLPATPADFSVARRASDVVVRLTVPTTNTDGSTPADLDRVDVYALTGAEGLTPDGLIRASTKVGSVVVNPPIDPDASQDEVDKAKAAAPPEGVDQGAAAVVTVHDATAGTQADGRPLSFFAVGMSERGRRGVLTRRIAVPLSEPPSPPAAPTIEYDESTLTLKWPASAAEGVVYHVYAADADDKPLTAQPTSEATFVDKPVTWDAERCYIVRSVRVVEGVTVESEASRPGCVTPKDTFPPKAPAGLQAIAAEGSVNLIWDPSPEADLAGYLVLRAVAPQTTPEPISETMITETTLRDTVPSGARVMYAVQAVDKAGNRSPMSALVEETVR